MVWSNPPAVAKFIAVAIVPDPAKIGIANGETAMLSAARSALANKPFLWFFDALIPPEAYGNQSKTPKYHR
ncbi:hypothetical protein B878_03771 [Vibrio campbellii CAIM 519 = NBRC 15631 = ATCC 25920]|nr:hypothetical protein B878_03771 [Vibrio campbellii CAIM 519 = NBRC 15631 = ATCC 25920]